MKQNTSGSDFALVPTKDAKWYVHVIYSDEGMGGIDPSDYDISGLVDYLYRGYYVIEALGRDTVCNNRNYHIYKVDFTMLTPPIDSPKMERHQSYLYYLWEDTIGKKVYCGFNTNPQLDPYYLVADFSDSANKGQVIPFPTWRETNIVKTPDLFIGGKALRTWSIQNTVDSKFQYFYKAQGIGTSIGILSPYNTGGYVWQTVSLDFVYKGDSVHFEYPYQ